MKPLLQLISVTKSFGAVRALRGVSFDLRAGEVHALLGENGAGKSTLIKMMTGAHLPDGGSLEVFGQTVRQLTPAAAHRLGIACIYQQPALFPDLTVAENIGFRLESIHPWQFIRWPRRRARAQELLRRVGAAIPAQAQVRDLSLPEQQLVEMACALGAGARIVIMDEPTASLTRPEQMLLFEAVRQLRKAGVGVVYISHRMDEIFALADRVTVLRDGLSMGTYPLRPGEETGAPGGLPKEAGQTATASMQPGAGHGRMDEAGLIRLMVGRELSFEFPEPIGAPGEVVLALKGVGCSQSDTRNVCLEVRAGEIVGLAGLVGAGRTELARILFGITPADAGEIRLAGRAVSIRSPGEAIKLGLAYVPEDRRRHGIVLEMPIAHNISMAVHRRLFPRFWLRRRAERQLALEYMRSLAIKADGPEAPASSLSGGNQQKVALARWLATRPVLLLLDEPTQGVDVGAKSEIHRIIRGLAGQGMAVLMISSDLPEILGMSDRIAVMRGGTIAALFPRRADAHQVMAAALGQASAESLP